MAGIRQSTMVGAVLVATATMGLVARGDERTSSVATFRAQIDTVALNVTVTGERGDYLRNLTQDDFVIYDEGVRQDVTVFGDGEMPIDLAVLLDLSASVYEQLGIVRSAAKNFLHTLRPGDRGAVVGFSERIRMLADWTGEQSVLDSAVDSARAGGSTALYDALYVALSQMGLNRSDATALRRQAMVVLSDGDDTSSLVSYDDVLEKCRRTGVALYTIRLERDQAFFERQEKRGPTPEYVMESLARQTGARPFAIRKLRELAGVYADIAEELSHQYLLGYVPGAVEDPGMFRRVSVGVPGRAGAQARTRMGYLLAPSLRLTSAAHGNP